MRRVVCEALPIVDPADEARRIVWEGMGEVVDYLRDCGHDLGPAPWPYSGQVEPPLVDMLVGEEITFVSPEADAWLTAQEDEIARIQAELYYSMQVAAVPRRHLLGYVDPL